MTHSDNLRNRAIVHYRYFLQSVRKVANIYGIGKSTLCRWLRADGIAKQPRQRRSVLARISSFVSSTVAKTPFVTTKQLSSLLLKELNITTSQSTIWRSIRRNDFTFKRTRYQVAKVVNNDTTTPRFKQQLREANNVVSIDETFFYWNERPKYGYSKRGQQLRASIHQPHRSLKVTLYMAVAHDRVIGHKLAMKHGNSKDFSSFIKSLRLQNATILLDNVDFHKTKDAREAMQQGNNHTLFIPPYSPQYNPIEMVFSKVKAHYRRSCVTSKNVISSILNAIRAVTNDELANYFSHVQSLL